MKNRIVKILNNNSNEFKLFDRTFLVEGFSKNGYHIPSGGVILDNNQLGGFIQKQGKQKWKIIGKLSQTDNIPSISRTQLQTGGKNNVDNEINLKNAVELLRDYYQTNFN